MTRLLAIDPGPEKSAYVLYVTRRRLIEDSGKIQSDELIERVRLGRWDAVGCLAVEMPACYGMAVGKSVFETCVVVGRLIQAFKGPSVRVYRKSRWGPFENYPGVCMTLCRDNRGKDANIRQAIIDRFPGTGGGAIPQIGTKGRPGPLYGVSKDIWAALAVALTWTEHMEPAPPAYANLPGGIAEQEGNTI